MVDLEKEIKDSGEGVVASTTYKRHTISRYMAERTSHTVLEYLKTDYALIRSPPPPHPHPPNLLLTSSLTMAQSAPPSHHQSVQPWRLQEQQEQLEQQAEGQPWKIETS